MSGTRQALSFDAVLDALSVNYAIPGDGEQSDIDSEFSDCDGDSETAEPNAVERTEEDTEADNLDDLHAIDVVESEDSTPS